MSECPHCHKAISIRIVSGNDEEGLPANESRSNSRETTPGVCKRCEGQIYWRYSTKKSKWYATDNPDGKPEFHNCSTE